MNKLTSRRSFLSRSAAAASASFFVNPLAASQATTGDRVRVAVIGINGRGLANLNDVVRTDLAEIVALCDVDETRSASVLRSHPRARFLTDYRRLFDQARDIDAVLVA